MTSQRTMTEPHWTMFQAGDKITRDGTDIHVIERVVGEGSDIIYVRCLKPSTFGWCKVGETEAESARRWHFIGKVIDA